MRGSEDDQLPLRMYTKRKMREAGLKQGAMARRAGVSPATLSTWLREQSRLDPDSVIKLCGALHTIRPHAATVAVLREAEALAATG